MALTLENRTENIQLSEELNGFKLTYRYQMKDDKIDGTVTGEASIDNRQVLSLSTSDGERFWGNSNEQLDDDLTGVSQQLKTSMAAILNNPTGVVDGA